MTRAYKSSLRTEHLELTRERILENVVALLAEGDELSVAAAAERAGVAVRTAYRHFPTKDKLLEGANEYVTRQMGFPTHAQRPATLPELVRELTAAYARSERLFRAVRHSPELQEMRAVRKGAQVKMLLGYLAPLLAGKDPALVRRTVAAIHAAMSADNWFHIRDYGGLGPEEAGQAVVWAVAQLVAAAR